MVCSWNWVVLVEKNASTFDSFEEFVPQLRLKRNESSDALEQYESFPVLIDQLVALGWVWAVTHATKRDIIRLKSRQGKMGRWNGHKLELGNMIIKSVREYSGVDEREILIKNENNRWEENGWGNRRRENQVWTIERKKRKEWKELRRKRKRTKIN